MRIRRKLPLILGVLLVIAALLLVVVLRKHAPPEPARLLPGADGFVYVNLQWMRRANIIGELPPVAHDPEYEQFIQATGFQFERDLEEAALAVHYPPQSGPSADSRFSEVFVARIQADRWREYLRKLASTVENYRSADIYSIPLEGRTLRVAILGVDTIAASNVAEPEVIRGIIDRSRKLASPFAGPALLRQYYPQVPLGCLAWAIFRIHPGADVQGTGATDWSSFFPQPAVLTASVRYLGAVHFKGVAFMPNEKDAETVAERVGAYLNLFQAAEISTGAHGPDPDVNALFASLKVEHQNDRAVLSAAVPVTLIRKILAEVPGSVTPEQAQPANTPAEPHISVKKRAKNEK